MSGLPVEASHGCGARPGGQTAFSREVRVDRMERARAGWGWALLKGGLLAAFLLGALTLLRWPEVSAALSKERLRALVEAAGPWGPVAHILLYAAGVTAFLPGTLLTAVGAIAFGKLWGTLYNLAGATAGAGAAFLVGRYLGRDLAARLIRGKLQALDEGNYDASLASERDDCQCGYTDPRDNHFARLSYQYTFRRTSAVHKAWLGTLPGALRFRVGRHLVHCCHGSPRLINEFLWGSTTPDALLRRFLAQVESDVLCCTHTGIKWERRLPDGQVAVNVGAIGRPENDGNTHVWYALLTAGRELGVEFIPVRYDHETLAAEMEAEGIPAEFVETIRTGWWTTCLESLPAKERARGRF